MFVSVVQVCLELSIFIILPQIFTADSQLSLSSLSAVSQQSLSSLTAVSQQSLSSLLAVS